MFSSDFCFVGNMWETFSFNCSVAPTELGFYLLNFEITNEAFYWFRSK